MNTVLNIPEHIKALIFDCDGTLVDSMPLHKKAWMEAFKYFSAPYEHEFMYNSKGMKETAIVELYNQKFGYQLDADRIVQKKHEHFKHYIPDVKEIQPVAELVRRFSGKLPLVVISGSIREIVHGELRQIGLLDRFDIILTADDPLPPKPAPDLFLTAAREINVEPRDCLVLEDGQSGIDAARAAGMEVINVLDFL